MAKTFQGRHRGRPAKYLWTAVLMDKIVVGAGVTELDIVNGAMWERSATGLEGATLVAVRGWLHAATLLSNDSQALFAYIGKYDEDEAGSLADVVASYTAERMLWTYGWQTLSAGHIAGSTTVVNVRAKARLLSKDDIRIVFTGSGTASSIQISGVLRGLLRLN